MGNKAINFLEYVQNLKNKYKEADWDSYENCNTAKDIIFKATEFYSQPFDIDLIDKCFDELEIIRYNIKYSYGTLQKMKTLDEFISFGLKEFPRLIFSPYSLSQLNLNIE